MTESKFNYRMVMRNSLGDLEVAVRALQKCTPPWELDPNADSITLVEAFNQCALGQLIGVSMRRSLDSND